jgi:hypothetical protein
MSRLGSLFFLRRRRGWQPPTRTLSLPSPLQFIAALLEAVGVMVAQYYRGRRRRLPYGRN